MEFREQRGMLAALSTLIILQVVMLLALFAGIRPHPPETTPLFGIAPFIGLSIAVAMAAIILRPEARFGTVLSVLAAILAALSFGPQKYFDAQFGLIWPAVLGGQLAIIAIVYGAITASRHRA